MAKDRKAIEKRRQAKSTRQRARAKERRRQDMASSGPPMDEFEMFRSSLTPPDLNPAIWNRRQILHDLEGRPPSQAIREYFDLFVDPASMEEGSPEANVQMEWGLFFWGLSVLRVAEREQALEEAVARVSDDPERQAEFRENSLEMIRTHEEMFPVLHAHLAQLRAATPGGEDDETTRRRDDEGSTTSSSRRLVVSSSSPPSAPLLEFARPLLDAAGDDEDALSRALVTASILWEAAQATLDQRAALLRYHRETLPDEDRAGFDEIARMMMRRYREMFAVDGRPTIADRPSAQPESDRDDQEPETDTEEHETPGEALRVEKAAVTSLEADRGEPEEPSEERPRSLLGRWLRRGR